MRYLRRPMDSDCARIFAADCDCVYRIALDRHWGLSNTRAARRACRISPMMLVDRLEFFYGDSGSGRLRD